MLQSVTVSAAIISMCQNETSYLNCFVHTALLKNQWEIKSGEFKNDQKDFVK